MPAKKAAQGRSAPERVQELFPKLKDASESLNKTSDKLNESVANFNAVLKPLGLGVTSWYQFEGGSNNDVGCSWGQEIGYTKTSGKWGIAIRRLNHDWSDPEPDIESWPFAEAPRALRVKAAEYIPELLEQLISDVEEMTKEVQDHAGQINTLTDVIADMGTPAKTTFAKKLKDAIGEAPSSSNVPMLSVPSGRNNS